MKYNLGLPGPRLGPNTDLLRFGIEIPNHAMSIVHILLDGLNHDNYRIVWALNREMNWSIISEYSALH
jgi:hypothetical protein